MSKRNLIPEQWLGAFKAGHRKNVREFIDEKLARKMLKRVIDSNYEDKEAIQTLDYLTKFNNEFHKGVLKKGDPEALHKTEQDRKEVYSAHNARNRDVMTRQKSFCEPIDDKRSQDAAYFDEEVLVDLIDLKRQLAKSNKQ